MVFNMIGLIDSSLKYEISEALIQMAQNMIGII